MELAPLVNGMCPHLLTFTIDRKIKRLVRLAEEEDITVEEFKQRIEELKKQKALLLAHQITKLDYSKISEKLKTVVSIYPYMTREEKSRLWHLLIIRIEAGKSLVSVYWRGGGKYTFKHDRLAKNLKVLNTKGRSVVAAGAICLHKDEIFFKTLDNTVFCMTYFLPNFQ